MRIHLLLLLLALAFTAIKAQNPVRPRQINVGTRAGTNAGRNNAGGDGRYRPNGDGRYRGSSDGRYVGQNNKYVQDNRAGGGYSGKFNAYKPDTNRAGPSGRVTGSGNRIGVGIAGSKAIGAGSKTTGGVSKGIGVVPTGVRVAKAVVSRPATSAYNSGGGIATRAAVQGKGTAAGGGIWQTIRQESTINEDSYHYLYETDNGILAEESGRIEPLTNTEEGLRSKGFFEYTSDDGKLYRIDYVADDNGFAPQGDHIPPVPPHIPKLLAYLAANGVAKK